MQIIEICTYETFIVVDIKYSGYTLDTNWKMNYNKTSYSLKNIHISFEFLCGFKFKLILCILNGLSGLINLEVSPPQQRFSLKPAEGISPPLICPKPLKFEGIVASPGCSSHPRANHLQRAQQKP